MLVEIAIRRLITYLEMFLILTVFLIISMFYIEICFSKLSFLLPLYLYLLSLATFNYLLLIGRTPKLLSDIPIQIQSLCTVCNIFISSMTFHCDTCNRCYFKRDHHCPWIGKCVAADNYKEFYFFIFFLNLFLGVRILTGEMCMNVDFLGRYIFFCIFSLFVWMNFLLCVDQSGDEYWKYGGKFKPKLFKRKWKNTLLNGKWSGIKYVLCPILQKSAVVVEKSNISQKLTK